MTHEPLQQPKKTSKSFTGCWTCRTRKIKCDEGKPVCYQCSSRSLACEGYGVRLQWITEYSDSRSTTCNRRPLSGQGNGRSQRRKVTSGTDASQQPLQHREIETILNSIDAVEPAEDLVLDKAIKPLFIHNFGVFDLATPSAHTSDSPTESLQGPGSPTYSISELLPNLGDPFPDSTYHLNTSKDDAVLPIEPFQSWSDDNISLLNGPNNHEQPPEQTLDDNRQVQEKTGSSLADQNLSLQSSTSMPPVPKASYLSDVERFLMHHYIHRVVNLFCVIDNQKSPWKLIHLPKALQSVGDLHISGSSSRIRDALRNALLSISAFCLSNDGTFRQCEDEAAKWAQNASRYRAKSIKLLKDAVEKDLHPASPTGYKEFLATMLSMVSINVMSGDTSTCKMHLDGALRLMNHARTWKSKYSAKAQSLHRIYFYLRTIYESTAASAPGVISNPSHSAEATAVLSMLGTQESGHHALEFDECSLSSVISDLPKDMTTWKCIYGVPQTLLVLLSRSTQLITQVTEFRQRHQTSVIPSELTETCDNLERVIMDLRSRFEAQKALSDETPSSKIIRKTTVAFQNALIIYFAQHIRLLGHRYLEPYVEAVLASIKEIEMIKAEKQILAAPLYWPAFIAGSEAFDNLIQAQFKDWYKRVEVYGIESARTGILVLEKIWTDGPGTGTRLTSQWMATVERMGVNLMLS